MKKEIQAKPIFQEQKYKKLVRTIQIDNYQLKFLISDEKFYIQCSDANLPYLIYENGFNLDELIAVHKYFMPFDDIKEISSFFLRYDEKLLKLEKKMKI